MPTGKVSSEEWGVGESCCSSTSGGPQGPPAQGESQRLSQVRLPSAALSVQGQVSPVVTAASPKPCPPISWSFLPCVLWKEEQEAPDAQGKPASWNGEIQTRVLKQDVHKHRDNSGKGDGARSKTLIRIFREVPDNIAHCIPTWKISATCSILLVLFLRFMHQKYIK